MRAVWLVACLFVLGCQSEVEGLGGRPFSPDAATARPDASALPEEEDASVAGPGEPLVPSGLCINELMASNDGAAIDEQGETDDWVELINCGGTVIELSDFVLADGPNKQPDALPAQTLAPGATVLFWLDAEPTEGARHLSFKLGKTGEALFLRRVRDRALADYARFDNLAVNESLARFPDGTGAFEKCRLASPGARNGDSCDAARDPGLLEEQTFRPYSFQTPFPARPSPLMLSELALKPVSFIELVNTSAAPVALDDWALTITPRKPGQGWPDVTDGAAVPLPLGAVVMPGARYVLPIDAQYVAALAQDPLFEGVVTLFQLEPLGFGVRVIDRIDFMHWPEGAVLARRDDVPLFRFCQNQTRGLPDACTPLLSRDVGDRVRHLFTPGDFAELAKGGSYLGMAPVKFLVEAAGEGPVHLFGSTRWPLHYSFVREVIDGQAPLDRCTEAGNAQYDAEWKLFIATEYFNTVSRRFLLATLVEHVGSGLRTVEFSSGDAISSAQMKRAFFAAIVQTPEPTSWALRPLEQEQLTRMRELEGQLPIVDTNAPYRNLRFQPLTTALTYGRLKLVPGAELATAELGRDVIVVTDAVPNDLPFAAGLITEVFQTPLAHVNLLSQSRHTPNMALAHARSAPELKPYFDQLVRFEVTASGFSVAPADPVEAQRFWDTREPEREPYIPRRDLSLRGIVELAGRGIADLPRIGSKAAQLAELSKVSVEHTSQGTPCAALPLDTPRDAFAVPLVHYVEHMASSGAATLLAELEADASFRSDPVARAAGLARVRTLITQQPVEPTLLSEVMSAVQQRFGADPVRMRSSSNAEDLVGFNGAGLYESDSTENLSVEAGIQLVWSSLWSERAYDERAYANISADTLAMGVLIHRAYKGERANGVAMSRNLVDLTRDDQYYVNTQAGSAAVTNPAPNVASDQLSYTWPPFQPEISYRSRSTFSPDKPVLSDAEVRTLVCAVGAVHDHFKALLDPAGKQRYFAIEVEFKHMGDDRKLAIKQARPFPFATESLPASCPTK